MASSRTERLAYAAYLYYVQGASQAEVATALGVTRSNVSRMLRAAREERIVRFEISYPLTRDPRSEAALKRRYEPFGVRDVVVATSASSPTANGAVGLLAVGEACRRWMELNLRDGERLGLCYGETVETMVNSAHFNRSYDVEVVQIGGELSIESRFSGHDLVRNLAEKLGGTYRYFAAPATTPDAASAQALIRTAQVSEGLEAGRRSDVAIVGVGAFEQGSSELFLKRANASEAELAEARSSGAVGQISGRFYDSQGEQLDLAIDRRILSLDLDDIRAIETVVGIAAGSRKTQATEAAVRGGLIDVLIVDESLAAGLIASS